MWNIVKSVIAILGLLSAFNNAVYAASGHVEGQRFKAWTGRCEPGWQGQKVCYLEQIKQQNGRTVLRAVIGYAPGKPSPTVFFELPPGIDIAAGVGLKVDKKKTIRFSGRCAGPSCSAGFNLNVPIMKQFINGSTAVISFVPARGKQPVWLSVSLLGVTAGLKALQQ